MLAQLVEPSVTATMAISSSLIHTFFLNSLIIN